MNKLQWIYGFYIDNNKNLISKNKVSYFVNAYDNIKFDILASDYRSRTEDDLNLNSIRQYISFKVLTNVINLQFNSDIFGSLVSNDGGALKFIGNYEKKEDTPYVELETSTGETHRAYIEDCIFIDSTTISTRFSKIIDNCVNIKFVSYKPYKILKHVNNINISGSNHIVNNSLAESIDNANLINIKKLDTFTVKQNQRYNRFLELLSDKETQVSEKIFNSVDLSNTSYLYQSIYNGSVNVNDLRNTSGGIYFEQTNSIKRVLFALLKDKNYYDNINTDWLNIQSNNIFFDTKKNIDDYESLSYVLAEKIKISKLDIENRELIVAPQETPQPTTTITPSISVSRSGTPRPSPEPSPTPRPIDFIYTWGKSDEFKQITDIFRASDIASVYLDITSGSDHNIVEAIIDSKRVFLPFGHNDKYQLGINLSNPKQDVQKLGYTINNIFQDPYKVSVGNKFTYVINANNNIFRWGDNNNGQLATTDEKELYIQFPRQLNNLQYIDISCGKHHTFIISDSGNIYFSGSVHGRETKSFIPYFTDNSLNYGWEKVFSYDSLSFAKRKDDDRLHLIGNDSINGNETKTVDRDFKNEYPISVGNRHALILKNGVIYAYGDNTNYQLGVRLLDNAQNYANYDSKAAWTNLDGITPTPTRFFTPTPTPSVSITQSITPSNTIDAAIGDIPEAVEASPTPTPTVSIDVDVTPTATPSVSLEENITPTPTTSLSSDTEATPTPTESNVSTDPNVTPSATPTISLSGNSQQQIEVTQTPTPSISAEQVTQTPTPSITPTTSGMVVTMTPTPSVSVSSSPIGVPATPTPTPTVSISQSSASSGSGYDQTFSVSNIGASSYAINGSSNPTLNLIRGGSYLFNISASGHPFFIKTSASTGSGSQYSSGVSGNGTSSGSIIFNVPSNAPSTLYYVCQFHSSMIGTISISGTGGLSVQNQHHHHDNTNKITTIGTNGRSSAYGTYDQNGNTFDMVLASNSKYTDNLPILGGSYGSILGEMTSVVETANCNVRSPEIGFRLCSSPDLEFFNQKQKDDEFILINDANNIADTNNLGTVEYEYSISKYPVTNKEYVEFLNYNKDQSLTYNLWEDMQNDLQGITYDINENNYVCKSNMANKPVNYLLLSNKLRYVNWKFNNFYHPPTHQILNNGVYNISFSITQYLEFGSDEKNTLNNIHLAYETEISTIKRTSASPTTEKFLWICNINEWYKAAYYNSTTKSYTKYATNSDTLPNAITAVDSSGSGDSGGTIFESNDQFVKVNDDIQWSNIAASKDYSLAISNGKLYGWGSNLDKSLTSEEIEYIEKPQVIFEGNWRDIKSVDGYNVGLSSNVKVKKIEPTSTPTPTISVSLSLSATPEVTQTSTSTSTPTQTVSSTGSISSGNSELPQLSPTPTPTISEASTTPISPTTPINNTDEDGEYTISLVSDASNGTQYYAEVQAADLPTGATGFKIEMTGNQGGDVISPLTPSIEDAKPYTGVVLSVLNPTDDVPYYVNVQALLPDNTSNGGPQNTNTSVSYISDTNRFRIYAPGDNGAIDVTIRITPINDLYIEVGEASNTLTDIIITDQG
jgi:hypothetical protein